MPSAMDAYSAERWGTGCVHVEWIYDDTGAVAAEYYRDARGVAYLRGIVEGDTTTMNRGIETSDAPAVVQARYLERLAAIAARGK